MGKERRLTANPVPGEVKPGSASTGDDQGPRSHRYGYDRCEPGHGGLHAVVHERADAEGRDSVAELVEGDHAARTGRRRRESLWPKLIVRVGEPRPSPPGRR